MDFIDVVPELGSKSVRIEFSCECGEMHFRDAQGVAHRGIDVAVNGPEKTVRCDCGKDGIRLSPKGTRIRVHFLKATTDNSTAPPSCC